MISYIISWMKKRLNTAEAPKPDHQALSPEPPGLKLLVLEAGDDDRARCVRRSNFFSATPSLREAPPPERSFIDPETACVGSYGWKRRRLLFPPPMTALTRTGRLPWRLARVQAGDGRLVIKEYRARRHQYCLRARREDGRLKLQLVYSTDDCTRPALAAEETDSGATLQMPATSSLASFASVSSASSSRTESEPMDIPRRLKKKVGEQDDDMSITAQRYSESPLRLAFPELCDCWYGHPSAGPYSLQTSGINL